MSDSVWPHRRQPSRLPRPWDSPGKDTGVGCHFLLQCMKVKSESEAAQSCLTRSNSNTKSSLIKKKNTLIFKKVAQYHIIREMEIKSTMSYHSIPVGMAIIRKIGNYKCWQRCGGQETPVHYWWEYTLVQAWYGQESFRRNGGALIVNRRVQKAILGSNRKNNRLISLRFQSKPFNITVIQVYAPTTNAKEIEVE